MRDDLIALAERCEAAPNSGLFSLDTEIAYALALPLEGIAKPYTASIDAAMTLKPVAADFVMDNFDGDRSGFRCSACVFVNGKWIDCKGAATPALALCAAALRARAAMGGSDD